MQPRPSRRLRKQLLLLIFLAVCIIGVILIIYSAARPPSPSTAVSTISTTTEGTPHPIDTFAVGDLIFRDGTAYESLLIKQLSGSHYSHIGVIVETSPDIRIIHATTDDDPARLNQVLNSSLKEFIAPKLAKSWAVYRINDLDEAEREQLINSLKNNVGLPFSLGIAQEEVRYCTTIINAALPQRIQEQLSWSTPTSLIAFKKPLLYPQAFLTLKDIEMVYESINIH